ncbi:MAG: D-alanyl-D-alanine carboxypeptidase [Boseongicola sp.]|nr:D-alanyl-D-alanine carboxypeptidase [Boseongicola sp.]
MSQTEDARQGDCLAELPSRVTRALIGRIAAVSLVLAMSVFVAAAVAAQPVYETPAKAALIYDFETDTVLFERDADKPKPPASMSKLMTLYMVFEALKEGHIDLDTTFTVSTKARNMGGSTMFLDETDRPTTEELIKGIVVQSGNDACVVVAEGLAGTEEAFAQRMTLRGREIGLKDSTFANASGWPHPQHRMSLRDLVKLAALLIKDFPEHYGYFAMEEFDYDGRSPANRFNRNPVLGTGLGADGLKTGHTEETGYSLVGSAVQSGRRLIFAFTGLESAAARRREAEAMIVWGLRQFTIKEVASKGDVIGEIPVWMGSQSSVNAVAGDDFRMPFPTVGQDSVTIRFEYLSPLDAPIAEGAQVAELVVSVPSIPERRFPLVSDREATRGGFVPRVRASSSLLFDMAIGQVQSLLE